MLQSIVRDDPVCCETIWLSVIRFSSDARQLVPLTEAGRFEPPTLKPEGGTALSRGLALLRDAIHADMQPRTEDHPGDYRPLVFLITDGQPNPEDPWLTQLERLMGEKGRRPGLLVAIGAGPEADLDVLKQLSGEHAWLLADLDATRWRALFAWIATSTVVASQTRPLPSATAGHVLAPAPPNLFVPGR